MSLAGMGLEHRELREKWGMEDNLVLTCVVKLNLSAVQLCNFKLLQSPGYVQEFFLLSSPLPSFPPENVWQYHSTAYHLQSAMI